jgi:hypothetical protein
MPAPSNVTRKGLGAPRPLSEEPCIDLSKLPHDDPDDYDNSSG